MQSIENCENGQYRRLLTLQNREVTRSILIRKVVEIRIGILGLAKHEFTIAEILRESNVPYREPRPLRGAP